MTYRELVQGGALSWNPLSPVFRETGDGGYWVFGPECPVRLAGLYADLIVRAIDEGVSLDSVASLAQEAGLAPFAAHSVALRWVAEGYLITGESRALPEFVVEGIFPSTTMLFDRDSGGLIQLGEATDSEEHDVAVSVVLVDDLVDVHAFADSISADTYVVCLRGRSVVVARSECWACFSTRHGERRAYEILAARLCSLPYVPKRGLASPDTAAIANDLLSHAARSGKSDVIFEWATEGSMVVEHQVVRVPGCPRCDPGGTSLVAGNTSAPRTAVLAATDGYRSSTPQETWDRYGHHVSELVGAVPWVRPLGRPSLHVYAAGPNLARVGQDLSVTLMGLRAGYGGKGTTAEAARAGALAEALERSSLLYRGDEPFIVSSYEELSDAVHPNDVHLFSESQLAEVDRQWESNGVVPPANVFQTVPRTFDPSAPVQWSNFTVFGSEEVRWVPASITWLLHPESENSRYFACSNGLAAGNTIDEAVLQSLLELIERDSVALWWYPRSARPAIDLDAIEDERIAIARQGVERPEHHTWVLDLTTDSGVPACVAVSTTVDGREPMMGFGAHLDPHIAITRALTELAQMLGNWESSEKHDSEEQRWFDTATLESEPWLAPSHMVPVRPRPAFDSVEAALGHLASEVRSMGLEILVKDCTRRDIGLPVVRTIVPGLRHFWNRLAPGRLFDMPPLIGWRDGPYEESDLNPWAQFL